MLVCAFFCAKSEVIFLYERVYLQARLFAVLQAFQAQVTSVECKFTFSQESRCGVTGNRWVVVREIKYWGLRMLPFFLVKLTATGSPRMVFFSRRRPPPVSDHFVVHQGWADQEGWVYALFRFKSFRSVGEWSEVYEAEFLFGWRVKAINAVVFDIESITKVKKYWRILCLFIFFSEVLTLIQFEKTCSSTMMMNVY